MLRYQLLCTSAAPRALVLSSFTLCAAALAAAPAEAKTAYLAAVRACVDTAGNSATCVVSTPPASTDPVPVWSFVAISAAEFAAKALLPATLAQAVVPGALLTADSGDTSGLTVNLLNTLPVPVSLVIPGQPGALTPVWTNTAGTITATGTRGAADYTSRVRSLNTETAPGATGTYTWGTLSPGSYIYESGTHQAVQVQMGLHGGLIVASGITTPLATSGTAYPAVAGTPGIPAVTYARQVTTYLSEIDSAMHRTIDTSPTHDATPLAAATKISPLEYWPDIFLTTQQVLAPDFTAVPAGTDHGQIQPGVPTLMRFMNATLRSHVEVVQNEYVSVLADDGHPYRYRKNQYSVLLEAGKTKDAILSPAAGDLETVAIYDRMLNTGGPGATQQGMISYLDIALANTPIAVNDSYSTPQNVTLTVPAKGVLANDVSPDKATLTAKIVTPPANGTLTFPGDGSFIYVPNAATTATVDAFSYVAMEPVTPATTPATFVSSKPATVKITLTSPLPIANPDAYTTTNATPLVETTRATGVLGNDTDPIPGHAATLTAAVAIGPTHGTLVLNADGTFTYTAGVGYVGTDSFTYQAIDGTVRSVPATVTITVTAPPPPVANADTYAVTGTTPLVVAARGVLANDTDPIPGHAATLTAALVTGPANGVLALAANGSFTYTATANFIGADSFIYHAVDGAVNPAQTSNNATVTINVAAFPPPVAVNDGPYTALGTTPLVVTPGVLANDTDQYSHTLTAAVVTGPAHGTVALAANGSFTYTATANYIGADSFTYHAVDGTVIPALTSNNATVAINVIAVPPPVAVNDGPYTTTNTTPLVVATPGVLANDTDQAGHPLTATRVTAPAHGTVVLNANGSFTYTATAGYTGADSFTYRAVDSTQPTLTSAPATVTVNVIAPPPVAVNDTFAGVTWNTTNNSLNVLANDPGPYQTGSMAIVSVPNNGGTATPNANGNGRILYTPKANFAGTETFTYQFKNAGGTNSNVATVTVTVVAPAPVAVSRSFTVGRNSTTSFNVLGTAAATYLSGSMTIVRAPNNGGSATANANGTITYTPPLNRNGTQTFTYQFKNVAGVLSNVATVTVTY